MPVNFKEIAFEQRNEEYLLKEGGYVKLDEKNGYDVKTAIFPEEIINYIKTSQKAKWERYVNRRNDPAGSQIIKRFEDEVKIKGLVKVLRHGLDVLGTNFKLVTFKPNTGLNEDVITAYQANKLGIVRQLHYSEANRNSLDTVLFLNGIPVVTIEFKNEYTGQNYENAIRQYQEDRDPKESIFKFNKGALVHFAVDTKNAYMCTKLDGKDSVFIPFNQGSNGPGVDGGAGNPTNPNDYDVSYLWEKVLNKESILQILSQYLQLEEKNNKSKILFPRFHQLDVVEKLINDSTEYGSGKNYLIQHSAGSGKSNSISWLAHRLINITKNDRRVFSSIIVVTDRKVLNSQLQDTIFGFDHVLGTVEKIDKDKTSQDLLNAINSGKDIIITTIQRFPRIFKDIKLDEIDKNFAIIIDEAHQSQTGSTAKALRIGLADIDKKLEEFRQIEGKTEEEMRSEEDLINEIVSQGRHKNLSFFAFTATPKNKTLETFGTKNQEGKYVPFHVYSMRQAIEEGFILDVLKNYTTYNTYFNINKKINEEDPELEKKRGTKQVLKFQSLHPYNISQKTAIILEHFNSVTKYKIGGKGKAMLVTSSRLHAIKYILEIKKQIEEKGLDDVKPLVSFTGEIEIDGITYSETKINKDRNGKSIQENQLPEFFNKDFNLLVVAEKYQTGFDEPLLHTMYVDKMLNGVKAVQTLSRLNRTTTGKNDTFVMDFANTTDEIRDSYQPYYQTTYLETPTDPNAVYDVRNQILDFKIINESDIDGFNDIYYSDSEKNAGKFSNFLNPAVERFKELEKEKQKEVKSAIDLFIRLYTFVTNIENLYDTKIHKFFNYIKFLRKVLPRESEEQINIDEKLLLEKIKYEKSFEGSISLDTDSRGLSGITGTISVTVEEKDSLSKIIEEINKKFGTSFTEQDKVIVEQIAKQMSEDSEVIDFINENNPDTFKLVSKEKIEDIILQRQEQNTLLFKKIFEDNDFKNEIIETILNEIYKRVKKKK